MAPGTTQRPGPTTTVQATDCGEKWKMPVAPVIAVVPWRIALVTPTAWKAPKPEVAARLSRPTVLANSVPANSGRRSCEAV